MRINELLFSFSSLFWSQFLFVVIKLLVSKKILVSFFVKLIIVIRTNIWTCWKEILAKCTTFSILLGLFFSSFICEPFLILCLPFFTKAPSQWWDHCLGRLSHLSEGGLHWFDESFEAFNLFCRISRLEKPNNMRNQLKNFFFIVRLIRSWREKSLLNFCEVTTHLFNGKLCLFQ